MSIKTLKQRGDTIIEVMVCLTILGLAITGAYRIATRSLAQMQDAQERAEALYIAEEQIERIKQSLAGNAPTPTDNVLPRTSGTAFCIRRDLTLLVVSGPKDCTSDTNPNYYVGVIYIDQDTSPGGVDNKFIAVAGRASIVRSSGGAPAIVATVNYKVY